MVNINHAFFRLHLRDLGAPPDIKWPDKFHVDDSMFIFPAYDQREIRRGPNIKALPLKEEMEEDLQGEVLLKVGDNITTDHIMPAGAKILPLRSNIPAMAEYVFEPIDPDFPKRAKEKGGGIVLGGENYGQGSSREHAALAPMYLGVKAVIAKSIARIHNDNLVNFGIIPLILDDPTIYDTLDQGDQLAVNGIKEAVEKGEEVLIVKNLTKGKEFLTRIHLSPRQRSVLAGGGMLNWMKKQN
jgi:aconitate hydratase